MRKIFLLILLCAICFSLNAQPFVKEQLVLEGNNIRSYIWNTGVFNQDMRTNNTPGCEWPKNSGKFVCFSAGLCIGAYVNDSLRMGNASYNGEYRPGYASNGQFLTDSRFKYYKIKRGDSYLNNSDWLNWGLMVPFGAPFTDMNNNGVYDYFVDVPGYKGASETVFICLTDADASRHTSSEGFAGGTAPLYAYYGLTAWCYDTLVYKDVQFFRWHIFNGGSMSWDSTVFSILTDPDLGDATDDYIGSDTVRKIAYSYNGDNFDGDGSGVTYGSNPPAWGITLLNCAGSNINYSGLANLNSTSSPGPLCEREPSSAVNSYNFMRSLKNDRTPVINISNREITKYSYHGEPETGLGWTMYSGKVNNCGGSLSGDSTIPVPPGNRRYAMNFEYQGDFKPGTSIVIMAAQMVARGNSNKNSVTLLKQLADSVKDLCQNNFVIGIEPVTNLIPRKFELYQNYPNPFNPITKIKFDISEQDFVSIKIYDAIGREISVLVNENLRAGEYSIDWNASSYPTGVYFYSMQTELYSEMRKMVLIK